LITGMPRIAIAVENFEAVIAIFSEALGMPVIDVSEETVRDLGARVAMCVPKGGSNIEIMSPAVADAPLSQSVQRFLDRRGQGLFALMLEAPDPNLEAQALLKRGLNVLPLMAGAGGRDVHPNSTHGSLIRVYPTDSFVGDAPSPRAGQPRPGLTGIQRVLMAVSDLEEAIDTYRRKFALQVSAAAVDSARGVRSALCSPPTGGVIELVQVEDADAPFAAAIARFLAGGGEGMYALVLHCEDIQLARCTLTAAGVNCTGVDGLADTLELDCADLSGCRFWLQAAAP
jgi:catechol 2,3-dioxygenase-like lactoylglutathione lyase family enzyme